MHPWQGIRRTLHYSLEPSHAPGISRARLRWESDIGNSHPLRVIETRRGWLFSGWIYIRWFRHRYLKNTTSMRSKLFSNAECVWREHKMNIFPWQRTRPAPMDRDSRKDFIRNELSSLQRLKHSILFNFEPTSKEASQMPPLTWHCHCIVALSIATWRTWPHGILLYCTVLFIWLNVLVSLQCHWCTYNDITTQSLSWRCIIGT